MESLECRVHYVELQAEKKMALLESRLHYVELQVEKLLNATKGQCFCRSCKAYFDRAQMKKRAETLTCVFCIRDQEEENQNQHGVIATALRMMEQRNNNTNKEVDEKGDQQIPENGQNAKV